jgi:hypothetical protein
MRPASQIVAYRPVIGPTEEFLYGQAGRQVGDPVKAAAVMLQAVDSEKPPLRLMLGADAYDIWNRVVAARNSEFELWRNRGEATAFDDAAMIPIGA